MLLMWTTAAASALAETAGQPLCGTFYLSTVPAVKNPSSALTQTVPQTSQDFSLIWTFNHSQLILTQTRSDVPYTVTDEWRLHVKTLSESGSLILQGLSSHQEGTYTCELSSKEETIITNSCVKIEEENPSRVTGIVGGAVAAILVKAAAVICLVLYCKKKPGQKENDGSDSNTEKTTLDAAF
ncbi:hypothetical protein EXN66_Car019541 [Channa argus]|uniref:Ig-like domain-containing protein n=1 Tax=Channa argus TaxID=215402 RepID=A0A6G1QNI4_CHAAH|nr:hypothetical protein EXN66_Car019541 [Channa argus]